MDSAGGDPAAAGNLDPGLAAARAALTAPLPFAPGACRTCRGPAGPGTPRCLQCRLHAECAPGSLASVVVPVAYAPKDGPHARALWVYKSGLPAAAAARRALAMLLIGFLRAHGRCVWRQAGWPGPTHVAVVPSSRGRAGPHPLRQLAEPYLTLPWASLTARPDAAGDARDLDPQRFAAVRLDGGRVLLLDDTWTTGASVQSAAMALRRAGASSVAVVVLGRHLATPRPGHPALAAAALAAFSPASCAVHGRPGGPGA